MNVCCYFQVHQPFRLNKNYTVFDVGKHDAYFDEKLNKEVMAKVAKKCYLPTNKLLLKLIKRHGIRFAFSITGVAIEQFPKEVLQSFQKLADTGNVEFLSETYHHSLAFLYDRQEFDHQVGLHKKTIKKHFRQTPKILRNTELIYNNEVASHAKRLGYKGVLAEGADHVLDWQSPNYVYQSPSGVPLLLKNYKLSDDVAFRFSDKSWKGHPLTVEKYGSWLSQAPGDVVNLFMDYETFGEHQWEDTGIFNFLESLPKELEQKDIRFISPSEALKQAPKATVDMPNFVSWADVERDLSAWTGNKLQDSALEKLYKMKQTLSGKALEDWRKLTTSDHFYYMCTKWFNDGDVHKYFNPYDSPYEGYIAFMNALQDLSQRQEEWITV
ncbi:alpha-amylase [Candidatus Woesearchaeota archaeon]|nr:alpha-amylase [Candidatus Woesearchaeota archaeon]